MQCMNAELTAAAPDWHFLSREIFHYCIDIYYNYQYYNELKGHFTAMAEFGVEEVER